MNKQMLALGRLKANQMNNTEAEYSQYLRVLQQAGDILWFRFEGIKLRLADKTFYTPDFFVLRSSFELEAHEVKGFMTDDAAVKIKVAAEMYPFRFVLVRKNAKKDGGRWKFQDYSTAHEETTC